MEGLSSEFGTHNSDTSTRIESPFSAEFPPQQMMTFAATASTTPTPTKPRSANKRPNKRQRAPTLSPTFNNSNPSNDKVTSSESYLSSHHFEDYKHKVVLEFKHLYRRTQEAKNTYKRISNLNSHDLTPHSLRVHPPKLVISHEEINSSLQTEFLALTTQYRKDLTSCYVRHLDLLVHALTKAIDDFPNQVRTDIVKIMETMQEPPFIQEVTSLVGPDSFQDRMAHWQQEFATEILKACDEVALTYSITTTIRKKATIGRDKAQSSMHDISHTSNGREIDIEMSDNEEYNIDKCPFTTPNYNGSEKPKKSSTNNPQPYPIQKPNPKANPNSTANPNPKPKSSTNNQQSNPFQKPNPNPNSNSKPKFPTNRNPRPFNHRNLPQYICNITNNQVSRNPHQNHHGPQVLLYNPNRPFFNHSYNSTNTLMHTVPSYAAEAAHPPRAPLHHPHIERTSNRLSTHNHHISASHEQHLRPTHHPHMSPEFRQVGYNGEQRSYFENYMCGDGGRLSHQNGGYISYYDKDAAYRNARYAIGGEIRTAYERSSCDNGGGYTAYPHCEERRTSFESGTHDFNRRQLVYPHGGGGFAEDGTSHGTNDLGPSFPPPPPPLLPTPPLHTSTSKSSHFPYAFNPNHVPLSSSLLPTNWMHTPTLLSRNPPHTPPLVFNNIPMHFPSFPPSNPQNVPLFPNHNPPPFYAHTPPFFTHDTPSTSTRFQYSIPPSKFPPCVHEIPHTNQPIPSHNNRPLPTKLQTFPCNNVRSKNV